MCQGDGSLDTCATLCETHYKKLSANEFVDKSNHLYLAISLESIKKDKVHSMGVRDNPTHIRTSSVEVSIAKLFENVNIIDTDFLKYLPNQFLNEEEIAAKNEFLANSKKCITRHTLSQNS